jgi:hypothetical protein
MPATPYSYVPGAGYVSRPQTVTAELNPFLPLLNMFSAASSRIFSPSPQPYQPNLPQEENREEGNAVAKFRGRFAQPLFDRFKGLHFKFLLHI